MNQIRHEYEDYDPETDVGIRVIIYLKTPPAQNVDFDSLDEACADAVEYVKTVSLLPPD